MKKHYFIILGYFFFLSYPCQADIFYNKSEIPSSLGGAATVITDVNDKNWIVGHSQTSEGYEHAFCYKDGTISDLGTLGGATSCAIGINKNGLVCGESGTSDGSTHAFIYENGVMKDIGTLERDSHAKGINNNGDIVGDSAVRPDPVNNPDEYHTHPFLYKNGMITSLMPLLSSFGAKDVWTAAINTNCEIVGEIWDKNNNYFRRAFFISGNEAHLIDTLGGGRNAAVDINENGEIVGWSETGSTYQDRSPIYHAFLYSNDILTDLGQVPVVFNNEARINDVGQVVLNREEAIDGNQYSIVPSTFLFGEFEPIKFIEPPGGSPETLGGVSLNNTGTICSRFNLILTLVNNPPTAFAGPDQEIIGDVVLDGGQSQDSDGNIVSYHWDLSCRGCSEANKSSDEPIANLTLDVPGFYDAILTVTDNSGTQSSDQCVILNRIDPNFDSNHDFVVDLKDAINILQILSGWR